MLRYAISDPHGCLDVLEQAVASLDLTSGNELYLLGDYVPHARRYDEPNGIARRCEQALSFVRDLCKQSNGAVHALMGNHEYDLIVAVEEGELSLDPALVKWVRKLPHFAETDRQIFVHAGIDEEAGEYWKWGSGEEFFLAKAPLTFGSFDKDIISGHVPARTLANRCSDFAGIFWDGASHYVIDGATESTGELPILRYDTETAAYSFAIATADGVSTWQKPRPCLSE